ncbi:HupU protein [Novosphingobium sp. FSY-8]|uniref:hydrogenase (acceptor) n=1 Tax=Novosphingobium ovatum TaxID=1908523 RepID=A0ABW9X9P0_9SPHN|nr:HupU protein [Novosphingobium ovatum]NBC35240.1 HupU protein [Novosphingobium ovatum]
MSVPGTTPGTTPLRLLWLQSGGCGGCTLSLLGAEGPDILTTLRAANVEVLWHPSLSEASGVEARAILTAAAEGRERVDILCLEGAVVHGPGGSGRFHLMAGTGTPMRDMIAAIASHARHVVAVGSCAAFGGITAGGGNPSEAGGLAYDGTAPGGLLGTDFRGAAGLPVINIAGCPIHPGWFVDTLLQIAAGTLTRADLDEWERPLAYTAQLVHHGCARNEFYEFKASAETLGDMGCMMEHLGCKGTQARADCNIRAWNGSGSCLDGNYPCINCTAPGFEEPGHGFDVTPKISGIPIGLPTDMPKAWFVALASLSKAATPRRLKENAARPTPVILPRDKRKTP